MDLKKINQKIKSFVKARDWEQFHSPKNLSMALSVEASELVEIFQWLKESDLKKIDKEKVADEIADIFFYLVRISQKMNIDIEKSFHKKMIKNIIDNFENHIDPKDPTNNCLDVAIITAPEKRTQKTITKLKTVAGRVLSK